MLQGRFQLSARGVFCLLISSASLPLIRCFSLFLFIIVWPGLFILCWHLCSGVRFPFSFRFFPSFNSNFLHAILLLMHFSPSPSSSPPLLSSFLSSVFCIHSSPLVLLHIFLLIVSSFPLFFLLLLPFSTCASILLTLALLFLLLLPQSLSASSVYPQSTYLNTLGEGRVVVRNCMRK